MSVGRLIELWAPPAGYRLASVLATTYELQADFIEDDLLPVALGLRHSAAKGRDFRLELEHRLQTVDVTIYLHPDGYHAGRRRSPRIDLIPVPESRLPKLHAKVSLLHFVREGGGVIGDQIVRLIVGSANLTSPGYRENIEVAIAIDDAPGTDAEEATAVRDAAQWLLSILPPETAQAKRQHRGLKAVFDAREVTPSRESLRFIGLRRPGGLLGAIAEFNPRKTDSLTLVSPFWATGSEPADVVAALVAVCKGKPRVVRLLGTSQVSGGRVYPEMPVGLVSHLMGLGAKVEVAAADPKFGCLAAPNKEADEYEDLDKGSPKSFAERSLHAKMMVLEGADGSVLAAGSFNITRKGLGLHGLGNTEAGLLWNFRKKDHARLAALTSFAMKWVQVEGSPGDLVRPPPEMTTGGDDLWPDFILSLVADRAGVRIRGEASRWPAEVKLEMRDLRSRLVQRDCCFDSWLVTRPEADGSFEVELALRASWGDVGDAVSALKYPPIPDLEIQVSWDGGRAVCPVVFLDKHEFPVVERSNRESERDLIDWFLGLRPAGEPDPDGFSHSIDPVESLVRTDDSTETAEILSYLIRDFVHALPGVRARIAEGAQTETGLAAALFGARSPVSLAEEVFESWRVPQQGRARKTAIATAFQLAELVKLVESSDLPILPEGVSEKLRNDCVSKVRVRLREVTTELRGASVSPVVSQYIDTTLSPENEKS